MLKAFTHASPIGRGLALASLLAVAGSAPAVAQTGYALLGGTFVNHLATFQVAAPATFTATVTITGLGAGQELVGIDARPNTGQLFALGYTPTTRLTQLYTLDPATGALTAVGSGFTLAAGTNSARIGFDFNPTVDRIRVTASNGVNLRLNPDTGGIAATDTNLAYATTDANTGQTPGVGSSAYTNSYIGSTATQLYNIDETASRLVLQNPPNNGTLNTVGPLGVTVSGANQNTDLDIYFNPANGQNVAYLTLGGLAGTNLSFSSTLYTVNLATGAATSLGTLGNTTGEYVTDIALAISRPTLAGITGRLVYALAGTNLLTFDSAQPGTIRTSLGITGVEASQTLVGLDVRPANNALYALGYSAAAAAGVANAQVYSINATTGAATAIGPAVRLDLGTGSVGFDFNPTVDRIRVVGANRNNYRLNPADGTIAATDGVLTYATGTATPSIGAAAYTNSFTGANAASGTVLYTYDEVLNTLNTQDPPNAGTTNSIGASGITASATTPNVDLDIYSTGAGTNTAYLVANTGALANTSLYTVNLTTGAATLVGAIGNGIAARDIAVAAATGVVTSSRPVELATSLTLYPNPTASATNLSFGLPRAAHVELTITDALGRAIDHLDAGQLPAGAQTVRWQRRGQAAGLYFFRLAFDGKPAGTRQVTLTH
jgi:hypothetical protein